MTLLIYLQAFFCAFRRLHVFASSFDWFIALPASVHSVVIGQSDYFVFGLTTLNQQSMRQSIE